MIVFDGHNDTLTRLFHSDDPDAFFEDGESGRGSGQIDLPRARRGGLDGGFFAIFTPPPPDSPERDPMYGVSFTDQGYITPEGSPIDPDYAVEYTDAVLDFAYDLEARAAGQIRIVRTYDELIESFEQQQLAMILHLEGAEAIREDLSNLEDYYNKGVRSIGLVWSRPNVFGHGVPFRFPGSPDTGPGLTEAGQQLVRACNDLGILVDMAHLNERGFRDVAALSRAPLVVTHSDVHAISPSTRNLTDEQIQMVIASDGVIGINFEAMNTHPLSWIDQDVPLTQITRHIDYIVQHGGIDSVAFGSDFDGAELPDDIRDVSHLPDLIETLQAQGYDQPALAKITGENWLRVLKATWR